MNAIRFMIEGTSLIFISTIAIDQDIPAQGIFRVVCCAERQPSILDRYLPPQQRLLSELTFGRHIPRPFGLGEPATFWPGANRVVAIIILLYHSYRQPPVEPLRGLQDCQPPYYPATTWAHSFSIIC